MTVYIATTIRTVLFLFACLLASPASWADTVELSPGRITGTIHLSSETIASGYVSAYATDNSSTASASFDGENFSVVVPAGKTWRLQFQLTPQSEVGNLYMHVSFPDEISVAASATVAHDFSVNTARVNAAIEVSNGTLVSLNYLQVHGDSFSAGGNGTTSVPSLIASEVSVRGTANLMSFEDQPSTQTLPSQTVAVTAAGALASWSLDAAFSAGSIQGSIDFQGAATPIGASVYLYSSDYTSLGGKELQGNGSFEFSNLLAGQDYLYTYVYFPGSQLSFYRTVEITAGSVSQQEFSGVAALAHVGLQLEGFLTTENLSGGTLYGSGSDDTSSYSSLDGTTEFKAAVTPGSWKFPQLSLQGSDTSVPSDYLIFQFSSYDFQRGETPVEIEPGETKTLPALNVTTGQADITLDVKEPAGTESETLISQARLNGYGTTYDVSGNALQSLSIYSANYGAAQAKPRLRIVGPPGVYSVQVFGTVENSDVTFGQFQIELKVPQPTPVGTDVTVHPSPNATLVFEHVTSAGVSTESELPVGPQIPSGYTALKTAADNAFYNISTTATFDGQVRVMLAYDPASVDPEREASIRMLGYDLSTQTWADITESVDVDDNKVTGIASSLSLFVLVLESPKGPSLVAPELGFSPLTLKAAPVPNGTAILPDYARQAIVTAGNGNISIVQTPAPGSEVAVGMIEVTLIAVDENETASLPLGFTVNVIPAPTFSGADDKITTTGGTTRLYPLANDRTPSGGELHLVSVSDPSVIIDGRALVIPAGFSGPLTYTFTDGVDNGEATIDVAAGSTAPSATWSGLLYNGDGAIAGIATARRIRTVIDVIITVGSVKQRVRFPATGATDVASSFGAADGLVDEDGRFALTIHGERSVLVGRLRPSATSATVSLLHLALAGSDHSTVPGGGYLRARITSRGRILISGKLPSGSTISSSASLLDNGSFVFYRVVGRTSPAAVVAGEFTLADLAATDVTGELEWEMPAQAAGLHAAGVSATLIANGSRFDPSAPLLDGPVAVTFRGAELPAPSFISTTATRGKLSATPEILSWTANARTGVFSAKVKPDSSGSAVRAAGVYLQKTNTAWGLFSGATVGGTVEVSALHER